MHLVLLLIVLTAALVFAPQWWASRTLRRHARNLDRIPGTGGELARHLLDRFGMHGVSVEQTERGDHYDPGARAVRLSAQTHDGRSLTAVAVAAHEVGHAIQHHRGEPMLAMRTRLVAVAAGAQRVGAMALFAIPVLTLATKAPASGLLLGLVALGGMLLGTLVHLITLPVEVDASFNKALPILREGYIRPGDEPAVRSILRAAALTYVAASLASLLNLGRWFAVLRR